MWTSSVEALRQHFPDAQLDLAYPIEYSALFARDTRINTHFPIKSDQALSSDTAERWKRAGYDYSLVFHASPSSRTIGRLSGAKQCIIHHHSRRAKNFGSDLRVPDLGKVMPATERDLNVVRALGWRGPSPAPRVFSDPEWKREAESEWRKLGGPPPSRLLVLGPGASRPSKRWSLENYESLVHRISTDSQVAIVATDMTELANWGFFANRFAPRARLVLTPKLEQLMGLLLLARCYVGADSGVKHLAAALGVPTVTLFGPESVGEWHPYSDDRHTALRASVSCRKNDAGDPAYAWCGAEVCPLASHACLSLISPADVASAIERYL